MPPTIALTAAGPWLAARAPHAAVRELLEFAAAFDGPVRRSVALELARATGADPSDEGHEERLEWLGLEDPSDFDPAAFDLASVNARLHGPVGGALGV